MNYGESLTLQQNQEYAAHLKRATKVAKDLDEKLDKQAARVHPDDRKAQYMWKLGSQQTVIEWLLMKVDGDMLGGIERLYKED